MVHDIPTSMQQPSDTDEAVRPESLEGQVSENRVEGKFPQAKPATEISRARAGDHDGIEVAAVGLLEQGAYGKVHQRHHYRCDQSNSVKVAVRMDLHQLSRLSATLE
jgi:hypothetical protein